jgi:hypothetical protein
VNQVTPKAWLLSLALLTATTECVWAQMPSPAIDRPDRPFTYFAQPTDQIGVAGAAVGAEITPEGNIYTGFGELMFFLGSAWSPVSPEEGPRYRTLEDGYLPIHHYTVERDGLLYHFTIFCASLGEQPIGPVAAFVRIVIENPNDQPRAAFVSSGFRYEGPQLNAALSDNRYQRPPSMQFSKEWTYGFNEDSLTRDGNIMYMFPSSPVPDRSATLHRYYNLRPNLRSRKLDVQPTTPVGIASYSFVIAPRATGSLDFRMPLVPEPASSAAMLALRAASTDEYHDAVRKYWRAVVSAGTQITVPESKANELFRASLVNDLLALNHVGDNWIQNVNQTHYHDFWLRDASDFVHMYDVTGYRHEAENVLAFYQRQQRPDGIFLSQPGQFDGWGQTLWIFGFHYRFTHDQAFAARVLPQIERAVDWLEKAIAADPRHLMPATDVKDNEFIPGHLTGYNFLALDGLQGAIAIARGVGNRQAAQRFQHDYDELRSRFLAILRKRARANGNVIPPALDGDNGGADWGNLLAVTPEPQLDPMDPLVSATLKSTQKNYQEGLILYRQPIHGNYLHHYLTIKNTLTELARGEQQQTIRELYALMLHTSATHSGFESGIRPWGSRDFQGNLAPHGWFAADYRNLARAMMVREVSDQDLHLLSAISPEWVGVGKTIAVQNAPTPWGRVDFQLTSPGIDQALFEFKPGFADRKPRRIILHLPWFVKISSVRVEGKRVKVINSCVELPSAPVSVAIQWNRDPAVHMSYLATVEAYEKEYGQHFQRYLHTGEQNASAQ